MPRVYRRRLTDPVRSESRFDRTTADGSLIAGEALPDAEILHLSYGLGMKERPHERQFLPHSVRFDGGADHEFSENSATQLGGAIGGCILPDFQGVVFAIH